MVETCLEGNDYAVCEAFNYCDEVSRPLSYGNSDRKVKCDTYTTTSTPLENSNYFVTSGCTATELAGCEAVTREVCTGSGTCDAVCQVDELGNKFGCQEVCTNYNCQEVTSYHGAECALTPSSACVISTQSETLDSIDASDTSSCTPFGECNQFGCAASACNEYGCPASAQYFQKDTVCEENYYCTDLSCAGGANNLNETDMRCFLETVDNGNPLLLNITEGAGAVLTNTLFQCNPVDSFEEGDPWCEYSASSDPVDYEFLTNRCESQLPDVCDVSPISGGVIQSGTENGCDVINGTGNDYWGIYNDACVTDSPITNVYEQACCFAYSIDNFDVYDNALTTGQVENGIRVY